MTTTFLKIHIIKLVCESFRVDKEIKNYINDGTLCKYGTIYVYKE